MIRAAGTYVAVVMVAALVPGCSVSPPTRDPVEPPEPPTQTAPEETPDPIDWEEVRRLLDAGERAMADNRLLTPEDDSAFLYYSEAAALAPDDPDVAEGFERIVERYIALAQQAIDREQWVYARSMLGRAAYVDPGHVGMRSLRDQLDLLVSAERIVLELPYAQVSGRDEEAAARLAALGERARQPNARVSIRTASDADARWIYEQLNRASGDRRIRGAVEIGLPTKVTILLLPPTDN